MFALLSASECSCISPSSTSSPLSLDQFIISLLLSVPRKRLESSTAWEKNRRKAFSRPLPLCSSLPWIRWYRLSLSNLLQLLAYIWYQSDRFQFQANWRMISFAVNVLTRCCPVPEYYTRKSKSICHSLAEGAIWNVKVTVHQSSTCLNNRYAVYTAFQKQHLRSRRIWTGYQQRTVYTQLWEWLFHLLVLSFGLDFSLYGFSLGPERAVVGPRMWVSCCSVNVRPPGWVSAGLAV